MIKSINQLAFRFIKKNKFIVITSILGIMLSISLVMTLTMFITNAKQSMLDEFELMFGKMDLAIGYNEDSEKIIDASLYEQLTNQSMIEEHSGVLIAQMYVEQLNGLVYTIGVNNDDLTKSRYHFNENLQDGDIVLNKALAKKLNAKLGENVSIENASYRVKEIVSDLEEAGPVVHTIILAKPSLQKMEYSKKGTEVVATYILVKVQEEQNIYKVAEQMRSIDSDLRIDIAQEDEYVKNNLDLLYHFMIVLSLLVLIITALFIISNFDVFLYKYNNQLAIMRSLGASTKQIFQVITLQTIVINLIGTIAAFILTLLLHKVMFSLLEPILSINLSNNNLDIGNALIITACSFSLLQLFMLIPAYKSSKILPIKIIRSNENLQLKYEKIRKSLGIVLMLLSILFISIVFLVDQLRVFALLAALTFVLAAFLLLPYIITVVLNLLIPVIKIIFGKIPFIATKTMLPQMNRNLFIISIISTMMIITVFGSTFIQTMKQSDENYVKIKFPTDITITVPYNNVQKLDVRELSKQLKDME